MEEPDYITVGQLKKELDKHPDHMPVVGIDNEFITMTEYDTVALEGSVGLHEFGVVRIC